MEYSSLYDLIENLEYGTKLHIGVIFFGLQRSEKLLLPYDATIHTGRYCWKIKEHPEDAKKCLFCRKTAIQKSVFPGKPFASICLHGVYEYTHPVFIDGRLIGIIFIGNILDSAKGKKKILESLGERGLSNMADELLDTMEHNVDTERCKAMGTLIESYIKLLLNAEQEAKAKPTEDSVIVDILTFIEENLTSELSIKTIAEIFHYNEKYMGRIFMKSLGCSIRTYICSRRIERAVVLLGESDDSITDIATRLGFENVTYFNRRFRQLLNMTPTEYRMAVRQGKDVPTPTNTYANRIDEITRVRKE